VGKFLMSEKENQIRFKTRSETISIEAQIDGVYKGKPRPFCLPVEFAEQNLYPPIRKIASEFFVEHKIKWHDGQNGKPSNHMCDSQVFCVNFLFPFADKPQELAELLSSTFPNIKQMLPVEDGYFLSFEWIGKENYLGEWIKSGNTRSRGANFTSTDSIVRFERDDGKIQVALIEWKYTESYSNHFIRYSKRGIDRGRTYQHLFDETDCPINKDLLPDYDALFCEPFYQLMRQQLLAHEMEKAHELEADIVSLLHIAPEKNHDFARVTSPLLTGLEETATGVWNKLVKPEGRFNSVHTEFLFREFYSEKMEGWKVYLQDRYPWLIEMPEFTSEITLTRHSEYDKKKTNWSEGFVDSMEEHFKIWYKDDRNPTALVSNLKEKGIVVQFVKDRKTTPQAKEKVTFELKFLFQ
jgi:hypothetical protein